MRCVGKLMAAIGLAPPASDGNRGSRAEHDRTARRRAEKLVELVALHLPVETSATAPSDSWALVGPALIARATGTLEAIFALLPEGRDSDALVLLRSLYEHVVTFAWLGADPTEERMQRWMKSDRQARLDADDDCRQLGVIVLTDEQRAMFERQVKNLPKEMPTLEQRTRAADTAWKSKIAGLRGSDQPRSFRGLYGIAYRHHSALAHPSDMGINRVVVDFGGGRQRVQLEKRDPEMTGPFGMAVVVYALGLLVASETLDWPPVDDVHAAFEH
jgi:hypothetical protein